MNFFQKNLKRLTDKHTQKYVAEKTGYSQSSINNYLTKNSEPSIQFLIALKNSFGISIDNFLFSDVLESKNISYDRFLGNYIVYYYNNSSYKGEVHTNLSNTLNYGVISIVSDGSKVNVVGTFLKNRVDAVKLLKKLNQENNYLTILSLHKELNNFYNGDISITDQSVFINLANNKNGDCCFMIFNNPPSTLEYIGGVGTVNTISRGREHNPCVEFIIISKKVIEKPDGEIYECLKFDDYYVNFDYAVKDLIDLFKRIYMDKNEISKNLTDGQKAAIIQNKLEYHFNDILDANVFRFAKVSNKEDDMIFKLLKEGLDV